MTTNTDTIDVQDSDVFGVLMDAMHTLVGRAAERNYPQRNLHIDIQLAARLSSILHGWTYCKNQKIWVATPEAIRLAGGCTLGDSDAVYRGGAGDQDDRIRLLIALKSIQMKAARAIA